MVGLGGLEPPTSRLSSARSNQLSYKPGRKEKSASPPHPSDVLETPKPRETKPQSSVILDVQKERRRRRVSRQTRPMTLSRLI
jgi:hypothetical protein